MENENFKITYSAESNDEIKSIREKYIQKEETPLERLRALDANVGKKATKVSLIIGIIGTLIMGFGMSLTMSDFGKLISIDGQTGFICGILLGVIGIAVLATAYPIYNSMVKKERKRIAPEILALSDELMENH